MDATSAYLQRQGGLALDDPRFAQLLCDFMEATGAGGFGTFGAAGATKLTPDPSVRLRFAGA